MQIVLGIVTTAAVAAGIFTVIILVKDSKKGKGNRTNRARR